MPDLNRLHKPWKNFYYFGFLYHLLNFLRPIPGSSKSDSDQQLVERFKASGDLQVLADLFQRYMDLLYGVCLKYLHDPALAQDAVMVVYETLIIQLPRHEVTFFRAWVYRVTTNYCLMQLRKNKRQPEIVPVSDMEWAENGHQGEAAEKEFRLNRMEGCLETLSPEQKEAVTMFYLQEKCYDDIVTATGKDWNRVRSLIQNGKRNLKICMEKQTGTGQKQTGKVKEE